MKPLPVHRYELAFWAQPRVAPDYHVEYDNHFYSVPYQLVGERLEVRATERTVEIFRRGRRVASHVRSPEEHKYTTLVEHMPRGHREYAEWTPQRLIAWGKKVGPNTAALVEAIMATKVHPEHGFKRCLGIIRLRKDYPDARLERACARALRFRTLTYRSVVAILQNNLDREELPEASAQTTLPLHGNLRGSGYYH